jgi:phosphoribosylamine--glycine ligase
VVKADGLAAGKGVIVASNTDEAVAGLHECFGGAFGAAGNLVVVE